MAGLFQQFTQIDKAFRYVRLCSILFLAGNLLICCWLIYHGAVLLKKEREQIYVLQAGELFQAKASDRANHLETEIKDHVLNFHRYFFTLDPDESFIRSQLNSAFYLCDSSAKSQYDVLDKAGFFDGMMAANISQRIQTDSIVVLGSVQPLSVRFYGKIIIIRSTSKLVRSLITECRIRDMAAITDHNPHGFLMENWKILANHDLEIIAR